MRNTASVMKMKMMMISEGGKQVIYVHWSFKWMNRKEDEMSMKWIWIWLFPVVFHRIFPFQFFPYLWETLSPIRFQTTNQVWKFNLIHISRLPLVYPYTSCSSSNNDLTTNGFFSSSSWESQLFLDFPPLIDDLILSILETPRLENRGLENVESERNLRRATRGHKRKGAFLDWYFWKVKCIRCCLWGEMARDWLIHDPKQ